MITVYFKPTNYCNVGCSHCYLSEGVRANKDKMDKERLYNTAVFIKEFLELKKDDQALIIWHGGEPLVLGAEYFKEADKIFTEVLGEDRFQQTIQTSLIPFRDEHIDVIHKYLGSGVGTSVDFSQRKINDSVEKYLDLFLQKVKIARDNDIEVIPGFVPTKNELGDGENIVKWFVENEFSIFNIDRYNNYGFETDDVPSNSEHAGFLIEIFDEIMSLKKSGKKAPLVNVVEAGIQGVLFGISNERWGTSCQSDFVVIEPNGNLNSCPDRSTSETSFANISDGANAFFTSKKRKDWIRESFVGHKESWCQTCEFNTWCKSGCPITPNVSFDECSGYKKYLLHIKKYAEESADNKNRLKEYIDI